MKRTVIALSAVLLAWQTEAQNTCATAIPAVLGSYYITQIDGSEAPGPICSGGSTPATMAEWYSYTATTDTVITVTTDLPQNAGGDTRIHVYTGSCGSLQCLAGNDDVNTSTGNYLSTVTFEVQAGNTYTIAFDNRWSANGFTWKIMKAAAMPAVYGFIPQYVSIDGIAKCIVDMNGDGLDDVVSVGANSVHINYQNIGGGFTDAPFATATANNLPSWSICAGDLDGNGYNDLVYAGSGLTFMMANSDGTGYTTINQPQYIFCQRSNLVDINNDGLLDAFSCHDVEPNVYYLNNGDGTWTWHQGGLGDEPNGGNYGSIWLDYNNDGNIDLFIAKCRGGSNSPSSVDELWRNNGDGTFTNVAAQMSNMADFHQSWSSAWADFDNDGDMDVMIGASTFTGGHHKLLRNNGGTSFTDITTGSGFDLYNGTSIEFIARDFDNDGYVDVLGGGMLLQNNGNMTFTPVQVPFNNGPTGDLNNDGFTDVQNGNMVYLNAGNDNNWITIRTVGTESNRSGIGARVEVTSAMGTQIRDIRSGDGFAYMSSLNAHFGIGTDDEISNVTVRWPSGIVNSVDNPAINSTLTITESASTTGISTMAPAELSLFPSPARNTLHLRTSRPLADGQVSIMDLAGKEVARPGLLNAAIDVSGLSSGMYLLKVEGPSGTLKSKFTKE